MPSCTLYQITINYSAAKMRFYCIVVLALCYFSTGHTESGNVSSNLSSVDSVGKQRYLTAVYIYKRPGHFYGEIDPNRIAGGYYAKVGEFPFMAVVHRLLGNGVVAECGGTVISSRWVLTAGHCVSRSPQTFLVVFGIIDRSGIRYDVNTGPGLTMMTTQGVRHPQYRQTVNDIGLLYMPRDIPFSKHIQPIRLARYNYPPGDLKNEMAYVIGWGKDRVNSLGTNALKYAVLPIISQNECARVWGVTDKNLCTAPGLGQDACQGDSGGPLIIMYQGQPLQVGIVSYGDDSCPSSKPGVFTKVAPFIEWIQAVIKTRS